MALSTKHTYSNRLYAHLTTAVLSSETSLSFYPGEITNLLAGWQTGSWHYLCIMDPTGDLEIVKMTGLTGSTLTVERGQGGTTARAWAAGSLVASRATAEHLTRFIQKGVNRSGAYNPNGVLTGDYTGEKYYQTGPDALQRRWWINTVGDKWRLMTGVPFTGEWWDDGYLYPAPWVEYFDDAIWSPNMGSWDDPNQEWDSLAGQIILFDILPWAVGYRPTLCRVTHNLDIGKDCGVQVKDGTGALTYGSEVPYISEYEIDLVCTDDIGRLYVYNNTDGTDFSVTNIEFA
jgi:hypothetical protein